MEISYYLIAGMGERELMEEGLGVDAQPDMEGCQGDKGVAAGLVILCWSTSGQWRVMR